MTKYCDNCTHFALSEVGVGNCSKLKLRIFQGMAACESHMKGEKMSDTEQEREARNKRAFEVASEVYTAVFQILDAMPELDGNVAGEIAQFAQDLVEHELKVEFVKVGQ